MKITAVDSYQVRVPIRLIDDGGIAPYAGSQDAVGVTTAQSLLIAIRTDEGITGWGEVNTGFGPGIDAALVSEWWRPTLVGQDPTRIRSVMNMLDKPYWPQFGRRAMSCAIEMALWDILGRSVGLSVSALLGGRVVDSVPTAFCLGITDTDTAVATAVCILGEGYGVLKTKIGLDLRADIERVHAVVDATDGRLALRLDANQKYDRVDALRMVSALDGLPVEYVEQPLPVGDYAGMRSLVERSTVPMAINEDAYLSGGLARAIAERSTDAAVVDLEGSAGVLGMVELAGLASANSLPLAHHCGWDLGVKAAMMLQVVSALPAFSLASDSTYSMHLDDVLTERLTLDQGALVVPTGPGIGIDVDEDAVRRLEVVDG